MNGHRLPGPGDGYGENHVNLALFVPGFPSREEDWFVPCVSSLVRGLGRHFRVDLYTMKYPRCRGQYRWHGLPVASFGHRSRILVGPVRLWAAVAAAREAHHRAGYDAVLALWGDETALAAAIFAHRQRLPLLLKLSAGEAVSMPRLGFGSRRSPWKRFCLWAGIRRAAVLGVGSARQREDLLRLRVGRASKPLLLPFGVDVDQFSPVSRSAAPSYNQRSGPALLAVGSLIRVKGFDLLLRALAGLKALHPGMRLRVVGDGAEREKLGKLAAGLGLDGMVTWEGWVEHRRMPEVYQRADLMVSASLHEAQGMASLEAMACGLPVVGSDTGMLPELLANHAAGIIYPAGDTAALGAALEMVLANRERWPVMGANGRAAVCRLVAETRVLALWRDTVECLLLNIKGPAGPGRRGFQ
jgi:glycosyltransferase involved in cell wall biosynthesis